MIMQLMTPDIPDRPAETGRSGKWWIATLVSLWVLFAVCVLIVVAKAHDGLAALVWILICSCAGAPVCLVLATISFIKREKHSVWTSLVALPCLALLAWELVAYGPRLSLGLLAMHNERVYNTYLDQLRVNPEIALIEHWPANPDTPKGRAFRDAVAGSFVNFSASQVEQIYAEVPSIREWVFNQAACTPEFISAHFQEAFDLARKNSTDMLLHIVENPHTPVQLVQRIVFFRKQLPVETPLGSEPWAPDPFGTALWRHKSDVPADPREILQTYVHEAEGKFFVLTLLGNDFRTLAGGGSRRFPDLHDMIGRDVNSYVPGVPPDFDATQLGLDEIVFLPSIFDETTDADAQQLHLAEAFALEHNQRVFQQKKGRPPSTAPVAQLEAWTHGKNRTTTLPNGVTLNLIWITPGTFTMGSPESEPGRDRDEGPQTTVAISKGFWLGKTLVTQGQYQTVMGNNPSHFADVGTDAPVEQVSWDDAMAFCQKLTERERAAGRLLEGFAYTLPTEAQWEYACRAGTTGARYGNLADIAWSGDNSGRTTHPVAKKQPNAWGLYDMLGNVFQWCSDWYGPYPGGNVTDPAGPPSGTYRVVRGACWVYNGTTCRSAWRTRVPGSNDALGFRVALSFVGLDQADALAKPADVGLGSQPASSVILPAVTATFTQVAAGTPGKNRTVTLPKAVTLDLIWIAPGAFTMGAPRWEFGSQAEERPQREVTISKEFWLGKTPVTLGQYQAVMGNNPSQFRNVGTDVPVTRVSWDDAKEFCRKLTEQERAAGHLPEGYVYTLPTEAQWEYACRAGTTEARYGNLDDIAWYIGNSGNTIHPVAQKQPNAWELYDMIGDVLEWCSDRYGTYPGGNVTDPTGPSSGSSRVYRSAGWSFSANDCRTATRSGGDPGPRGRNPSIGFRLALAPSQTPSLAWPATNVWPYRTITLPKAVTMDLMRIAPGTFTMGDPCSEDIWTMHDPSLEDCTPDDVCPQTVVTISKEFWLGKTPVTQGQYQAVMGNNPSHFTSVGADAPVETVSWDDAKEFCRKLTEQERAAGHLPEGYVYTLPTEAQWEYACRAGTTGAQYGKLDDIAWYTGNSGNSTHPVAQKQPNDFGLYDMIGNVCEWCLDEYGPYAGGNATDPAGPGWGPYGAYRVYRGGDWAYRADHCRSAVRHGTEPDYRGSDLGFRLALAPAQPPLLPRPATNVQPTGNANFAAPWTFCLNGTSVDGESIAGALFYRGQFIPMQFHHVATPIGEFQVCGRTGYRGDGPRVCWAPAYLAHNMPNSREIWMGDNDGRAEAIFSGKEGEMRTTKLKKNPPVVSNKSCIPGSFENRPIDAGADWFFVFDKNLWVDPEKISEVEPKVSDRPLYVRNFGNMGVLERDAVLAEFKKQALPSIFQAWIDAERVEHDPGKHACLSDVLAGALHEQMPTPEFLAQLQAFINDPVNSELDRARLRSVLDNGR